MTSSATANYNNRQINELWDDLAEGYFNLGRADTDAKISKTTLKDANDNMVQFIINKLQISADSHILDLGCGMGMYTVQIAARTGCQYIGTDINEAYLKKAELLAQQHGVADKGRFLASAWGDLSKEVLNEQYSHVLCLGALLYGHPILETALQEIALCCGPSTKVLIWDLVRRGADIGRANLHLKMPHVLATKEEVFQAICESQLELTEFEDVGRYVVPGYKVLAEESAKRDPEKKVLTFYLMLEAIEAGKLSYVLYYCKLK